MYDPTPPPFGDVTRRWTQLTDPDREHHVHRLLGTTCPAARPAHVARPGLDGGACYRRLVESAVDGDRIAIAWLATTHRPLLLVRGRALFEHDPSEWGAVSLEALHTIVAKVDHSAGRWLRRRVAERLGMHVSRIVDEHLVRRRRERATAPADLRAVPDEPGSSNADPHLDLSVALDRVLGRLDDATRDAFCALANEEPLVEVAVRHGLSHAAVRQRLTRARKQIQPALASYRRSVA